MIYNIVRGLTKGFEPNVVSMHRSIIGDCMPYPKMPDLEKYLPIVAELAKYLFEDNEKGRQHEREMIERFLKGQVIKIRAEERKRIMEVLVQCIEKANTAEERLAYLDLYYRITKESLIET